MGGGARRRDALLRQPGIATVGGTKDPDVAAIGAIAPDLVVVNDEENRREDADDLAAAGFALHEINIRSVAAVDATLADLAVAVGAPRPEPAPSPLVTPPPDGAKRAFLPVWRRPWMTVNAQTYGSSVLEAVGLVNIAGDEADRYPVIDPVWVEGRRPDVVLAPTEPYPFSEKHRVELEGFAPVVFVDGRDLFWWGTRTRPAIDRLRRQLG